MDKTYCDVWDGLTEGQQDILEKLATGGFPTIVRTVANNGRHAHWKSIDPLVRKGLLKFNNTDYGDDCYAITDLGREVFLAGNPQQAALEADTAPGAVTVEDAYDRRLWERGTLTIRIYGTNYNVTGIVERGDGLFNCHHESSHIGKTIKVCFADDFLDYTPAPSSISTPTHAATSEQVQPQGALSEAPEIAVLRARVVELEAALRPFADRWPEVERERYVTTSVHRDDFKRAAVALNNTARMGRRNIENE